VTGDCSEIGHVWQRFDLQELLGPDEAEQDDQAGRQQESHQQQDVAGALGREEVHQQQCHPRARCHGNDGERHHRQHCRHVERHARAACATHADQHRCKQQHDHPRRLANRAHEARMEQPPGGNRSCQEEAEILRQEKRRQRRDDSAEREKWKNGQEQPGQAEPEQVVAELLVRAQLAGEPERSLEDGRAHQDRDRAEYAAAQEIAALSQADAVP
jgi:hypothetical protein